MKKQLLIRTIACITALLTMSSSFAFASNKEGPDSYDTLSRTQNEYLEQIYPSQISLFSLPTDADSFQIERVCIGFLSIGWASTRDARYSVSPLILEESKTSDELLYRQSEYEYLYAVHEALGWTVYKDDVQYSDFKVEVDGDEATASVVESYTYYMDSDFDSDMCFRGREYYFDMERAANGNWYVVSVTSNDPQETAEDFVYEVIDVDTVVDRVVQNQKTSMATHFTVINEEEILGKTIEEDTAMSTSLYQWYYDTDVAAAYAESYYNSYNSLFGQANEDCQNFASQCVWAGLGGTTKTGLPAVSLAYLANNSDRPNLWCRNQASTYYSDYRLNWTWDNVNGFAKMMKVSSTDVEGLWGNTHYGHLRYAAKGSVISYTNATTPTETNLAHAMFVTEVTGSVGSRTRSNIWIAAHNSNTTSAYMPLVDYSSKLDSQYVTSLISCGYYSSYQP